MSPKVKIELNSNFEDEIMDAVKNSVKDEEFDLECPHCSKQISVKVGKNKCPYCKNIVNVELKW